MKASFALALAGSLLAVASPIKRVVHTDYVTDVVYVTVTVDPATFLRPGAHTRTHHHTTTLQKTSTTSTPTPAPAAPTTTSTPAAVPEVHTVTVVAGTTSTPAPAPAAPATTTTPAEEEAAAPTPATTTPKTTSTSTPVKAAATTQEAAAAASPTDYSSTAVYHHNLHRSNHSAPAASWDSDLASYAATVAAKCVFAHDLTPGQDTGSYGQNIAAYGASGDIESASSSKMIAQAITDMWYNGEAWQFPASDYGAATPNMDNFEAWGHFSQVVWVASTQVGCATQFCPAGTIYSDLGSWFSVCNYRSAGNMGGAYGSNVKPALGHATVVA